MLHHPDCRKYRQWKREQAKKSKETVKKIKKKGRKEAITDCIDEGEQDDVKETALKVSYERCKERNRRRKPRPLIAKTFKRISVTDLILRNIKPSLEERERLINPRHADCLRDALSKPDSATEIEEIATTLLLGQRNATGVSAFTRKRRRTAGRKSSVKTESRGSECSSVCSFDSEVCLAGLKLTAEDKKEIKKYQPQRPDDEGKGKD